MFWNVEMFDRTSYFAAQVGKHFPIWHIADTILALLNLLLKSESAVSPKEVIPAMPVTTTRFINQSPFTEITCRVI